MVTAGKENIIALVWDFDKTLAPGYMEDPFFRYYGVEPRIFWDEANHLPRVYKDNGITHIAKDTLYLNHILTYVQKGIFKNLSNKKLRELGKRITFYKGLPDFFQQIQKSVAENPVYARYNIRVEHYIVSTGIKEMILGSSIAPYVDGIWANEFIEDIAQPHFLEKKGKIKKFPTIQQLGYTIDHTSKTRALFEINKGSNKTKEIDVNMFLETENRRVPFDQMIYIADGPSDIPCFSVVNQHGGKTFSVYQPQSQLEFMQVNQLHKEKRVQLFGEADYTKDSYTAMTISHMVESIAQKIITQRPAPKQIPAPVPRHIVEGKFVYEEK